MIVDKNGNERPITSDEYIAERCLQLEEENKRLKDGKLILKEYGKRKKNNE